jgi:hypothetical protein
VLKELAFQASMRTPTPELMRIIQLVCSLLSIRYNKMMSCVTTLITICEPDVSRGEKKSRIL